METPTENGQTAPPIELQPDVLPIPQRGITAKLWKDQGRISVYSRDWDELFSFAASACPFQADPISFLFDLYRMGYERGKLVGRESARIRMRELLGSEL